jgi:hypothetical protein
LLVLGRFDEARGYATRNEQVAGVQGRAARAQAVAWWVEIEGLARDWTRVRGFEKRVRDPVHPGTQPRVSGVRAVLLCAAAGVELGDEEAAVDLERLAATLARGPDDRLAGPYLRLALARRDLDRVEWLLPRTPRELKPWATWWSLELEVTRLDALAALGDADAVAAEAAPLLGTGDFTDAVAKRALGHARGDPGLVRDAEDAFTRMSLPGHVTATRWPAGRR